MVARKLESEAIMMRQHNYVGGKVLLLFWGSGSCYTYLEVKYKTFEELNHNHECELYFIRYSSSEYL